MAIEPGEALLWKFANDQCSDSEIAYIKSWLSADPENLKKLQRIQVYLSMNPHETNNTNLSLTLCNCRSIITAITNPQFATGPQKWVDI